MDLEHEWEQFMVADESNIERKSIDDNYQTNEVKLSRRRLTKYTPKSTDLKISTKSKILYLNQTFDLEDLFWKLKTINYDEEAEGIIKKQMKFNFKAPEDVLYFESKIVKESPTKVTILNQINNPSGHILFKDVRKVDVGMSKNDVLKPKKSSKSAFYNCFVIIFRKIYEGSYREFHLKLFNSGKIEIPGIQKNDMLELAVDFIIGKLQPHCHEKLFEYREKRELVLVNSNFNCQYYLDREILLDILKEKYKIKCNMDSCSYPGIQCKYEFTSSHTVSFMIFRTGSVLIVGKCSDTQLDEIYNFLVQMFHDEYYNICEEQSELELLEKKKASTKKKKKKIISIYV